MARRLRPFLRVLGHLGGGVNADHLRDAHLCQRGGVDAAATAEVDDLADGLAEATKAMLCARAESHRRSVEAEVREILADVLKRDPITLVDLLSIDEGANIEFEPQRLGLTGRAPAL